MFDIGFAELILLAGLGLIVLGPQRLPRAAAQLGRWVGQARRMSRTLMYQLRQEVNLDDPKPSTAWSAGGGSGAKTGTTGKQPEDKNPKPDKNPDEPKKMDSEEPEKDAGSQNQ